MSGFGELELEVALIYGLRSPSRSAEIVVHAGSTQPQTISRPRPGTSETIILSSLSLARTHVELTHGEHRRFPRQLVGDGSRW